MAKRNKLKVFISHDQRDVLIARNLCERLRGEGWIEPWISEEQLLPGHNWRVKIEEAVIASDAVILCFSDNSVRTEGFIQREFRLAIAIAYEKLDGQIFLIPLRISECVIPSTITRTWHYEDYFSSYAERGYQKLLKSLMERKVTVDFNRKRENRSKVVEPSLPKTNPFSLELLANSPSIPFSSPVNWKIKVQNSGENASKGLKILWGDEILAERFSLVGGEEKEFSKEKQYDSAGEHKEKIILKGGSFQKEATGQVTIRSAPNIEAKLTSEQKIVKQFKESVWMFEIRNTGGEMLKDVSIKHHNTQIKSFELLDIGQSEKFEFRETYASVSSQTEELVITAKVHEGAKQTWKVQGTIQVTREIMKWGEVEFVMIPAGSFIMGSDPENGLAFDDEFPQHTVDIPYEYWIGRYPVTNKQFADFVLDSDYITSAEKRGSGQVLVDGAWKTISGATWRYSDGTSKSTYSRKKKHPVILVSWIDAQTYCDWLNDEYGSQLPTGMVFRLPTEAEWEKASRGDDGSEYPWGNSHSENVQINIEREIGDTTEVGKFSPFSDSPYGVIDTLGNVWEWTSSLFMDYPYNYKSGRENLSSDQPRVLRGGSFVNARRNARCACRHSSVPDECINYYGFRIVVGPKLKEIIGA